MEEYEIRVTKPEANAKVETVWKCSHILERKYMYTNVALRLVNT